MEQPVLYRPNSKARAKEVIKKEAEAIEVKNASDLKTIELPPKVIRLMIKDKINIDLIYIEPGSFIMGRDVKLGEKILSKISATGMVGKYVDDWPARNVTITKGFYIAKYKVTSSEFCNFLNSIENPQDYIKLNTFARIELTDGVYYPKSGCENCSVNTVHWKGAVAYCNWLSNQTGFAFRLPTEAEWEFTARGSEDRPHPWGQNGNVEWVEGPERDYKTYPHPWSCAPVDAFPDNVTPDGVVGMAGLVTEWCSDYYGAHYLKNDVIDPKGPGKKDLLDKSIYPSTDFREKYHVYRGRGYGTISRDFGDTVQDSGIYGFRIVLEQP